MNSYNKAFKQKIDLASKALDELNEKGCAIINMQVGDAGNVITILPPPNNCIKGHHLCTTGNKNGRQYHNQTRLHGCTVRWSISQQQ
ncbi:hypothetical protein [Neptunicella sp. SCSIO 80796]|uniref:hypothetical protein n=1 Tax=Neptunicella plasticusilytica TaxID=3117012 RepID=UPI003A4DE392